MEAPSARALTERFVADVRALPDGSKIDQCLQCGTCTASCPSSEAMEYPPRTILAALRAGMLDRVLRTNTMWLCASCYSCAVRCPVGIPFTDIMAALKRAALRLPVGTDSGRFVAMTRAFTEVVDGYGRNAEMALLRKYYTKAGPARALSNIPLGWRLLRKGRISFSSTSIKGRDELRRMMDAISAKEAP